MQTAVRMPRELYERLQTASEGRPLGEEIRRRLEASFADAPPADADPVLDHIARITRVVRRNFGDWHTHPGACAILHRAIDFALAELQPDGDPVVEPTAEAPKFMQDCTGVDEAARMAAAAALWEE